MARDLTRPNNITHFGLGWAIHHSEGCDRQPHKHDAIQLLLSPKGETLVGLRSMTIHAGGLLIGSGVRHSLSDNVPSWMLYIDRDCECAAALSEQCAPHGAAMMGALLEKEARCFVRDVLDRRGDAERAFDRFSARLGGTRTARPSDPRVDEALSILAHNYRSPRPLAGFLRASNLSHGWFSELFKACTGLPVRTHARWLRMGAGVDALAQGTDLDSAANVAGYSSAIQFVNSFRHVFGVRPETFAESLAPDLPRAVLDIARSV